MGLYLKIFIFKNLVKKIYILKNIEGKYVHLINDSFSI